MRVYLTGGSGSVASNIAAVLEAHGDELLRPTHEQVELTDAANAAAAQLVLVSTDWVFDGTQGGADEPTPPNPISVRLPQGGRRAGAGRVDALLEGLRLELEGTHA